MPAVNGCRTMTGPIGRQLSGSATPDDCMACLAGTATNAELLLRSPTLSLSTPDDGCERRRSHARDFRLTCRAPQPRCASRSTGPVTPCDTTDAAGDGPS